MPEAKPRDWRIDVLRSIGAPVTSANMAFLAAWQQQEGGHTNNRARFNWLNTTQGKQFPTINSVGVRSFPSYNVGIQQTVSTLQNGRYRNIVAALRTGNPIDKTLAPAVAGDLQVWVSGRRSGNPEYAKRVYGSAAQRALGGGGVGGWVGNKVSQIDDISDYPGIGGPAQSAADTAQGVAGAAKGAATGVYDAGAAVAGGFKWVFGNWDRMFMVAGGAVLVVIGLVLLARSSTGKVMSGPVGDLSNRLQYGPTVVKARSGGVTRKQSVTLPGDQPSASRRPAVSSQDAGDIPF